MTDLIAPQQKTLQILAITSHHKICNVGRYVRSAEVLCRLGLATHQNKTGCYKITELGMGAWMVNVANNTMYV